MEIVDEALKISSPFQMKGEVVLLYEKPKLCKTRLKRIVAMQWLHPALPSKTNMLILHSHVNAADLGSLHLAMEILARRTGCDVVAYDYAGYGGSDGTPGENIILQNADTVMRYVIEVLQRPTTKVIVYGQSIGSVPTWYLASKYEVAGVIQLSGLHSGWRTLCRNRKSSAPFGCCCLNPFNNAAWIKNIRAPVLLIHGTEDEVIQFSQALEMRRLCGRLAVEPLWAEGLGHMGIERTRVFYQRISRFINEEVRHFKNTSPTASMLSSDSSFSLLSLHQPSQQQQQTMQKADTNPAPIPSLFLRQSALPTATTSADRTAAAVIRTSAKLKVFPILRIHGAYSPDVSTSTSLFRWRTKIVLTTLACHKGCFGRRGPRPMAAAKLGAIVRHSKPGDAGRGGSGFANRKRSCWLR
ncbi:uncharacterized protein LOC111272036 isoform X1 [Varroa jacobsoni]|uniref:uncharacterized protein LOC111272036 isoform X1 n=2 Tax=Varroa jacobsoni TaxID=62625 RepID=UPI000BF2ADD8|nr:uncharacterized protein LOC111272036 isoform X1 [Varroa jacobsoni]